MPVVSAGESHWTVKLLVVVFVTLTFTGVAGDGVTIGGGSGGGEMLPGTLTKSVLLGKVVA